MVRVGNPFEHAIEAAVGYAIDWNATGTWVAAIITALAVFMAAILTDIVNRRTERRLAADRLEVLSTIYGGVGDVIEEIIAVANRGGRFGRGFLRTIDDLIAVLDKVPVLDLPGREPASDLVVVRRIVGHIRDSVDQWVAEGEPPGPVSLSFNEARARVLGAEQRVLALARRVR
jgi:hypothetical protein